MIPSRVLTVLVTTAVMSFAATWMAARPTSKATLTPAASADNLAPSDYTLLSGLGYDDCDPDADDLVGYWIDPLSLGKAYFFQFDRDGTAFISRGFEDLPMFQWESTGPGEIVLHSGEMRSPGYFYFDGRDVLYMTLHMMGDLAAPVRLARISANEARVVAGMRRDIQEGFRLARLSYGPPYTLGPHAAAW